MLNLGDSQSADAGGNRPFHDVANSVPDQSGADRRHNGDAVPRHVRVSRQHQRVALLFTRGFVAEPDGRIQCNHIAWQFPGIHDLRSRQFILERVEEARRNSRVLSGRVDGCLNLGQVTGRDDEGAFRHWSIPVVGVSQLGLRVGGLAIQARALAYKGFARLQWANVVRVQGETTCLGDKGFERLALNLAKAFAMPIGSHLRRPVPRSIYLVKRGVFRRFFRQTCRQLQALGGIPAPAPGWRGKVAKD